MGFFNRCALPVTAQDAALENAAYSNANLAVTMPSSFEPEAGKAYDILVNLAVPVTTSGYTATIGGAPLNGRTGDYKRLPAMRAPFVMRVAYFGTPAHYNFISMRTALWMT